LRARVRSAIVGAAAAPAFSPPRPPDAMKVLVCATGLTGQFADAVYSTKYRANAMAEAGLDVTVIGAPAVYPPGAPPLRGAYRCAIARRAAAEAAAASVLRRRGRLATYLWEPFAVLRAAWRTAVRERFDVFFVSHLEPVLALPFLPVLGGGAGPQWVARMPIIFPRWRQCRAAPRGFALRAAANRAVAPALLRRMPLLFCSPYGPPFMGLPPHPNAIWLPDGHEDATAQAPPVPEARRRLGLPTGRRMALLFGAASRAKGGPLLLRALEGLPPELTVCMVGAVGGSYEGWGDRAAADARGWTESLIIVPRYVTDEEMRLYYAACDAVVIPFERDFPGDSTHLRRAAEFGKAVIACDQYLIGETVRRYDLGWLFPPGDAEGLRAALADFARAPDARFGAIRARAMRAARERSWTEVGRRYRELFEKLTAADGRRTGAGGP